MPHYSDGTEAKNGDLVIGRTYNTPYEVVGVIHSISPGETCNCQVQQLVGIIDDETSGRRSVVQVNKSDHAACQDLRKVS